MCTDENNLVTEVAHGVVLRVEGTDKGFKLDLLRGDHAEALAEVDNHLTTAVARGEGKDVAVIG